MSKKSKRSQTLTNQSVAIYPGFGLIQGVYKVYLDKGENKFQLAGLPARLDSESLFVDSFTGPGAVELKGSSYRAANLTPSNVQAKAVNHKVTVHHGSTVPSEQKHTKGVLLNLTGNIPGGTAVLEVDGDVQVLTQVQSISLPLPDGLHNTPSVAIRCTAEKKGWYFVRLLYKTGGMGWNAEAKWIYNRETSSVEWISSVKVVNSSGAAYPGSKLKVVAGDVSMENAYHDAAPAGAGLAPERAVVSKTSARQQVQVQNLGQAKAYVVPGENDVEEGERQTLPFISRQGVPVKVVYHVKPLLQWHNYGNRHEHEVRNVFLAKNDEAHKLALPLPFMSVQVMHRDAESQELLPTGSGYLQASTVGEDLELDSGADSDLKAVRLVKSHSKKEGALKKARKGADSTTRKVTHTRECAVELFNGKDHEVTFVVFENLSDGCELQGKNSLVPSKAAGEFESRVTVAPGQTATVEFTVVQVEEVVVELEAAEEPAAE